MSPPFRSRSAGIGIGALTVLLLPALQPAGAASPSGNTSARPPSPWIWLVPGGGQFALGRPRAGWGYAAGTMGLVGWGAHAETRRGGGELNAPFVYAQQLYVASFCAAYRELRLRAGDPGGGPPTDRSSAGELAAAPFRWRQLKNPWVIGSALVGAGLNLALPRSDSRKPAFRQIRRIRYLGDSFNREWGTAAYTAYWIPISLGAGVAEESLFRGLFQNEWERSWGARNGWAAASGLFGLAHLSQPGDLESWGDVAFATAAGLYLGWRYQRTGYRLEEPVASHVWFDIAAGLALMLVRPEDNPLGARVQFAF
ncbi:MAG: CPBP family intramembrane glutamic endopeptidase [Elusimicrobiota bacterium]